MFIIPRFIFFYPLLSFVCGLIYLLFSNFHQLFWRKKKISLQHYQSYIITILLLRSRCRSQREKKKCDTFSICACHPCAGAMLIFSVSFQFLRMTRCYPGSDSDNWNHNHLYTITCALITHIHVTNVLWRKDKNSSINFWIWKTVN